MKEKLAIFIENNYEKPLISKFKNICYDEEFLVSDYVASNNITNFINDNKTDNKFQKLLFSYIDQKNLKDSDVYNKVNIDRRLFSKIRNDNNYHPSKETIILLAISLELNLDNLLDLLQSASYYLPKNNYFDLIIRFCFMEGIYNLNKVNELLYSYDCNLLI